MPGSVEHRHCRPEAAMLADADLLAHRERAVMSDAGVIANQHARLFAVARGKKEGTFALDRDIVADQQLALALHPMDVNAGMQMAAILSAVNLKQRLRDEYTPQEVIGGPYRNHQDQHRRRKYARSGHAESVDAPVHLAQQPRQPVV